MSLSIHTFEVTYNCEMELYNELLAAVKRYTGESGKTYDTGYKKQKTDKQMRKGIKFTLLRKRGINSMVFNITYLAARDGSCEEDIAPLAYKYSIKLKINPLKLIGSEENLYTCVISKEDCHLIKPKLYELLKEILPEMPDIFEDGGKITRLDYCYNLWFESQDIAEEYFTVLRKYKLPAKFMTKRYLNTNGKKVTRDGEVTLRCNSYEVSLYLKHKQLKTAAYEVPEDELKNAEGQLRIEYRLRRRKLNAIKKKFNIENDCELLCYVDERPEQMLYQFLASMYGVADFYTLEEARKTIIQSEFSKKVKQNMQDILTMASFYHSLNTKINGIEPKVLRQYMKRFGELQISPITISERSRKKYYPNPGNYLLGVSEDYLNASGETFMRSDSQIAKPI